MPRLFPEINDMIIRKVVKSPNIKEVICFDDKGEVSLWMDLHVEELRLIRDKINDFLEKEN